MEKFSDDKKGKIETCFGGFDVRLTARIIACLKVSFFRHNFTPFFGVRRRTVGKAKRGRGGTLRTEETLWSGYKKLSTALPFTPPPPPSFPSLHC